jgi:hypothetical protein
MSKSNETAAASQQAEKLFRPLPRPQSTYEQKIAILEQQRRAQDEKTARLRALRLAKEAGAKGRALRSS